MTLIDFIGLISILNILSVESMLLLFQNSLFDLHLLQFSLDFLFLACLIYKNSLFICPLLLHLLHLSLLLLIHGPIYIYMIKFV